MKKQTLKFMSEKNLKKVTIFVGRFSFLVNNRKDLSNRKMSQNVNCKMRKLTCKAFIDMLIGELLSSSTRPSRLVSFSESEAKRAGNEYISIFAKQKKRCVNAVARARLQAMSAAVAFILVGNKNE